MTLSSFHDVDENFVALVINDVSAIQPAEEKGGYFLMAYFLTCL
jgi:hypothetical protein